MVVPRGRIRIFEVGHEDLRAGIERVDDHLSIHGSGNFDATIKNVSREGRDRPCGVADSFLRLREKVRLLPSVKFALALLTRAEQGLPPFFEFRLKVTI